MSTQRVLRVVRDPVGWTVDGDRHPRSYVEKSQAIERATVLAEGMRPCQLVILNDDGGVEEERRYD